MKIFKILAIIYLVTSCNNQNSVLNSSSAINGESLKKLFIDCLSKTYYLEEYRKRSLIDILNKIKPEDLSNIKKVLRKEITIEIKNENYVFEFSQGEVPGIRLYYIVNDVKNKNSLAYIDLLKNKSKIIINEKEPISIKELLNVQLINSTSLNDNIRVLVSIEENQSYCSVGYF
ncbi:hypothetical protein [Aquimarina brevivitae]|uniref:Lipoprotein n=1 Tax=Aquimarina brevivitae TaxID=323412 RepID=A0A4Q7P399_9FLAO|nr:hypothetical protein [Aquimarina brevivitae]RZS93848.1 hypothetical protein EV197_2429 [Aquimarina brevivitae]